MHHSTVNKMSKINQNIKAVETGALDGDGKGSRNHNMMPTKGGRNATTNEARRGAGQVAPRPQNSRQPLLGSSAHTGPTTAGMARVQDRPSSAPRGTSGAANAGSFTPVQTNAYANLTGQATGQNEVVPRGTSAQIAPKTRMPMTSNPVASGKPKRKGLGSAFFGEY
jgi:hypothetical protein